MSKRGSRRLAGLVFIVVVALLMWLSVALYNKDFSDTATVTMETGSVGHEMHPHADVKMRGVVVGEVKKIQSYGDRARITLSLKPGEIGRIPANVSAQMLPTTLFGLRYVELIPPKGATAQALKAGDTIPEDRSSNAIELQQALNDLLPMLTAVKPDKLSATLSAVSMALEGRGTDLGQTAKTLDSYLRKLNPHLPAFNRDVKQFVEVGNLYADTAPDLLDALTDITTTSATLVEEQKNLATLYAAGTTTSQDVYTFLRQNSANIIRLSQASRPTLQTMAKYAPAFPCTLSMMADFVPKMDRALGKGTSRHGLHVDVRSVPSRGRYVPGRDTPVYGAGGQARCYPVPFGGGSGTRSMSAQSADVTDATPLSTVKGGLGLPNSPQENQLVNELLAPGAKARPDDLPDWSSVLAGPTLRGTEVSLK
ncbi:MCE family protein [Streptomyces sp. B1866]|uniref:MCE family protein n=1 Tax=Streptomyces sp. B1866 TaxID=3075431 RepID=UPI00288D6710|nr:MCE family protein [Streptomyces sp. B1866]MDT3397042.1 MCE family protein [Streptomyces sp. B1866]